MKQGIFEITENTVLNIAGDIFRMRLEGDTGAVTKPGQFVNVQIPGLYLRRPISVCDKEGDSLTLIYKTVGLGTKEMAQMKPGQKLDLLTGLGNGYDPDINASNIYIVGGGVGIPPLFWLVKELLRRNKRIEIKLGFNTYQDAFYVHEFRSLTSNFGYYSVNGSIGAEGYVTNSLDDPYMDYVYACGPLPMLKAVFRAAPCDGQLSLEERMGCGFGACMGCSIMTKTGPKRVCKDGPVFRKEELLWDD